MIKTIKIQEDTHKKLESVGNKGETFDKIISRLVEFYKENKGGIII